MSKKKRNKQYKGSVSVRPQITRMSAVKRNPAHQWWVDHKRAAKPALIAGGVVALIAVVLVGLVGLIW